MTDDGSDQTKGNPGVSGEYTTRGKPHGVSALTPFLAIEGARDAIAFYRDVFGARVVDVTEMGGVVAHAVLDLGDGQLQLGEPSADYGLLPPPRGESGDGACYSLGLYVENADVVVARAEAAGAVVREPLMNFVSGDRFASVRDPFGVRWSVMSRIEDLSEPEAARRVADWAAAQG
ncbi:MAG: VOC family protein [Ornithinimicrobium sp.]